MQKSIESIFPIIQVCDDLILSVSGAYTVGYELTKPEIFTLHHDELDCIHQAFVRGIDVLSPGCTVHLQDWLYDATYEPDSSLRSRSWLSAASDAYFKGRQYIEHKAYLFLSRGTSHRLPGPALNSLLKRRLLPEEPLDERTLAAFQEEAGRMERLLNESGLISCRRLSTVELTGHDDKPGIIEQYCMLTGGGVQPSLVRDIDFHDGVQIGELKGVLYTLADATHLPHQCGVGMRYAPYSSERTDLTIGFATPMGPLLPCNHIYNQYIFVEESRQVLGKLELKRRRHQSVSAHSRESALARDGVDGFLNEAIAHQKKIVGVHVNVFAWTDQRERIPELRKLLATAISQLGATPHLEHACAPQIWWAGIPGNASDLPSNERFTSFADKAACFLLFESPYRSSRSPFGFRLGDRTTGKPVHVDISDEPMEKGWTTNRNKFILGGSGSGKSFFTNHLLRNYYEQGAHIVIVDIGDSYQGLCRLVEGAYYSYSPKTPPRFNPFWLPAGSLPDMEKRESLKTLLLALWKKEDEVFLRSEYVALSGALQLYYERLAADASMFPCFDSFYAFLSSDYTQQLEREKVRSKDFDVENFLYVLRPYAKGGEYDYLLNAREQLDLLDQRLIVFELDVLKDHPVLFPVVTIIIMDVFISKMRQLPGIRKVILIEEAWKAIARQGMSEYIKYLFKTVRKLYGEAIVVTQELDDILSSPIVRQSIINNADTKILLDQRKFQHNFDAIQNLLGLSEKDKAQVLSLNRSNEAGRKYKEVFISTGVGFGKVYRTEVSPAEYLAYTTEQKEKLQVLAYAERLGGMEAGIRALANKMKTEGL